MFQRGSAGSSSEEIRALSEDEDSLAEDLGSLSSLSDRSRESESSPQARVRAKTATRASAGKRKNPREQEREYIKTLSEHFGYSAKHDGKRVVAKFLLPLGKGEGFPLFVRNDKFRRSPLFAGEMDFEETLSEGV